jgi:hypothetical protein
VLTAGVVLLFTYVYVRGWALYGLVTPLLLTLGAALIAYASRIRNLLHRLQRQQVPAKDPAAGAAPAPADNSAPADSSALARRTTGLLIYVVIAASIFWATATVAQWSGRGLAEYDAEHFNLLPSVILDTRERLFLRDGCTTEL